MKRIIVLPYFDVLNIELREDHGEKEFVASQMGEAHVRHVDRGNVDIGAQRVFGSICNQPD
ncbi:hypothetical protein D3C87_1713910 [compost metagenome]